MPQTPAQRALFVTTLPVTLTAFLLPHADALRQRGWEVDCVTAPVGAGGIGTPADETLISEHFRVRYSIGWSRSAARSLMRYPSLARQVRAIVAAGKYDIVHTHTPIASFIVRAALRKVRRVAGARGAGDAPRPRIIYTAHGFHFMEGETRHRARLFRMAERRAAFWTDDLVVMNDQDERAAVSLTSGTGCAVTRIDGVGIDLASYRDSATPATGESSASIAPAAAPAAATFEQLATSYDIAADDFVVASIGELNRNKRTDLLVQAAHVLRDRIPQLKVVLAGDGPMREALEEEITLLGLGDVVKLLGHVSRDTLRVITEMADIGILVSEREGLPRSLMEFVAAGTPIAGTKTRGIVDEVIDGRALADEADPNVIARVIERLHADPALRLEIHRAQYERAQERYELPVILEKYRKLYRG